MGFHAAFSHTNGSFYGTQLENNDDLNNIKQIGSYFSTGGNVIANKPEGVNAFNLDVYRTAGTCIGQKVTASGNRGSNIFVREYNDNKWTLWEQLALKGDLDNCLLNKGTFSGDFNNPDIPIGVYNIESSGSYVNGPKAKPGYCAFVQLPAANTQIIFYGDTIYTRKYTGNPKVWSGWAIFSGLIE